MSELMDQLTDLQDSIASLDSKVTTEEVATDFLTGEKESNEEHNLWMLIYVLVTLFCFTWLLFCCFCCYMRKRSQIEKR